MISSLIEWPHRSTCHHPSRHNRGEATGTWIPRQIEDIPSIISIQSASNSLIALSRIRAPLPLPQRRQGPEDRPAGTKAATQARSPLRTHGGTYQTKKRTWGTLNGAWVPQSIRDAVVQFVQRWAGRTNL